MKLRISPRTIVIGSTLTLAIATAGTVIATHADTPGSRPAGTAHKQSAQTGAAKTPSTDHANGQSTTTAPPSTSAPPSNTIAGCELLTLAIAQQILGSGAAAGKSSDTSVIRTPDTTIATCAYTAGSDNIQLIGRSPKNALGTSENATIFGSGKPPNAIAVPGYGQVAYWDPAQKRLNILSHNNWYIISRGNGSQAAAEAIAALLTTGLKL